MDKFNSNTKFPYESKKFKTSMRVIYCLLTIFSFLCVIATSLSHNAQDEAQRQFVLFILILSFAVVGSYYGFFYMLSSSFLLCYQVFPICVSLFGLVISIISLSFAVVLFAFFELKWKGWRFPYLSILFVPLVFCLTALIIDYILSFFP